jgi:hypothetical protein
MPTVTELMVLASSCGFHALLSSGHIVLRGAGVGVQSSRECWSECRAGRLFEAFGVEGPSGFEMSGVLVGQNAGCSDLSATRSLELEYAEALRAGGAEDFGSRMPRVSRPIGL